MISVAESQAFFAWGCAAGLVDVGWSGLLLPTVGTPKAVDKVPRMPGRGGQNAQDRTPQVFDGATSSSAEGIFADDTAIAFAVTRYQFLRSPVDPLARQEA